MELVNIDFIQITSVFLVLFGIIDIIGSIPIILQIKEKGNEIKSFSVALVSFLILLLFFFMGEAILNLFNVDVESFAIAGALIIFIFALEMVLDVEFYKNNSPSSGSAIVPIAFPLVAGPASFTTLLSLRAKYDTINILIALLLNILFVWLVLNSTSLIERIFGKGGIYIFRKFFGIILLAISIKLFMENIGSLLGNF